CAVPELPAGPPECCGRRTGDAAGIHLPVPRSEHAAPYRRVQRRLELPACRAAEPGRFEAEGALERVQAPEGLELIPVDRHRKGPPGHGGKVEARLVRQLVEERRVAAGALEVERQQGVLPEGGFCHGGKHPRGDRGSCTGLLRAGEMVVPFEDDHVEAQRGGPPADAEADQPGPDDDRAVRFGRGHWTAHRYAGITRIRLRVGGWTPPLSP